MATVTILSSAVQGLPAIGTGETIVAHSNPATITQVGSGYFYQGAVVDTTLIGAAGIITTLKALGAIV